MRFTALFICSACWTTSFGKDNADVDKWKRCACISFARLIIIMLDFFVIQVCNNRRVYSTLSYISLCIWIANYSLFHYSSRERKLIGEVQNENDSSSHRTFLTQPYSSLRMQLYLPIVQTFSPFSLTLVVRSEKFSHSTRKHQRLPCSREVLCTPKIEFKLKNFDKSCWQKGFLFCRFLQSMQLQHEWTQEREKSEWWRKRNWKKSEWRNRVKSWCLPESCT